MCVSNYVPMLYSVNVLSHEGADSLKTPERLMTDMTLMDLGEVGHGKKRLYTVSIPSPWSCRDDLFGLPARFIALGSWGCKSKVDN